MADLKVMLWLRIKAYGTWLLSSAIITAIVSACFIRKPLSFSHGSICFQWWLFPALIIWFSVHVAAMMYARELDEAVSISERR